MKLEGYLYNMKKTGLTHWTEQQPNKDNSLIENVRPIYSMEEESGKTQT